MALGPRKVFGAFEKRALGASHGLVIVVVYHLHEDFGLSTVCAAGKQNSLLVTSVRIDHSAIPNLPRKPGMSSTLS